MLAGMCAMVRGLMWAVALGVIVATNGFAQANPGHHGHGHAYHQHGYYGPRFGVVIAPPPVVAAVPVFAPPPVAPYPVPAYGYPVYGYAPVYAPAPVGFGVQTRNFSFFLGR